MLLVYGITMFYYVICSTPAGPGCPGSHCTDALGGQEYRRLPTPLRSTSPFSGDLQDPGVQDAEDRDPINIPQHP